MTGAAVAYFTAAVVVTILVRSGDLAAAAPASSVDELAEGDLLGLLASGLPGAGPLAMPQIALTALAAAVVISREGATVWWVAALVGHVGSALISYGVVGLASALGSGAARDAENDPDYGISAVLAATLGALLTSGPAAGGRPGGGRRRRRRPRRAAALLDRLARHPALLAFGLGAAVALRLGSAERDTPDPCGGAPS